jgi:hypothetical protein
MLQDLTVPGSEHPYRGSGLVPWPVTGVAPCGRPVRPSDPPIGFAADTSTMVAFQTMRLRRSPARNALILAAGSSTTF